MRDRRKLGVNIPMRHRDAIEVIWRTCGRSAFVWAIIAKHLSQGPGVVKKLNNDGYLVDCGYAMRTGRGNQKIWKLSHEISLSCEEKFGPVNDQREQQATKAVEEHRKNIESRYSRKSIRERHIMVKYCEFERDEIRLIQSVFQGRIWVAAEVRRIGVVISSGKLKRWREAGIIERAGRREGDNRNSNKWKLTETQLSSSSQEVTA